MITFKKLTLVGFALIMSLGTGLYAQSATYYQRLYYTCKVWGHVKYFHTEVANGNVNWDQALLDAVDDIKQAPDDQAFNQALIQMINGAGSMGFGSNPLPVVPDSLNNNSDRAWMNDAIFTDSVKIALNAIRQRFRPQNHVLVDEAWAGGNPTFDTDNSFHLDQAYPSEEKRILALFRYWNIIHYFFPYKYIMDQHWDSTLVQFIPEIVDAPDALGYSLAFKAFTASINDSHAFFYTPTYFDWLGSEYPPFLARFIEDEMVVTKVLPQFPGIKQGDIIKEIDGHDVYELRDSLRRYAHGSNDVIIERELNNILMRGDFGAFSLTLDDGSGPRTTTTFRTDSHLEALNEDSSAVWKDTVVGSCNFGIIDMGRLVRDDIPQMFSDLWDTDVLIFDIRSYPNGTLWTLVNYLYESPIHIASFTVPDITYPGRLTWSVETIGSGTSNVYAGKVVILFDERTQSQAEYTCMGLEQFPDAIKIGSTTSAADGNVTRLFLPGQITTYASFLGVYYPDYGPTQRIGIIPDYEVKPSIAGIQAGRDEVMEFALNCNLVQIEEEELRVPLNLYPNPATHVLNYELSGTPPDLIELLDFQGRILKRVKPDSGRGQMDISSLAPGIYSLKVYAGEKIQVELFVKK